MGNTIKKGSRVYVSATDVTSDLDAAGYAALTWVEISSIVTAPEIGISTSFESRNLLESEVTDKQKGYSDAGESTIEVAPDGADDGQIELRTVGDVAYRFTRGFKIESNDEKTSGGTNSVRYSRGLVGGPMHNGGSGTDFDTETYTIAFVQKPVVVYAT